MHKPTSARSARWPVVLMVTGAVLVAASILLAAYEIGGFGAEADIGGGLIIVLGFLLAFAGAVSAVAARPRRTPTDVPAASSPTGRRLPGTWPSRMLVTGLVLIVGSNLMLGSALADESTIWIPGALGALGTFLAVGGFAAVLAYRQAGRQS